MAPARRIPTCTATFITAPIPAPDDRARQWLTLVDDGNYAQGWAEAGSGLKAHASAATWTKQAGAEREPLGAWSGEPTKSSRTEPLIDRTRFIRAL